MVRVDAPQLQAPTSTTQRFRKSRPLVGDFLRSTLDNHPDQMIWLDREQGIFRFLQPYAVAARFGSLPGVRSRKMDYSYCSMTHGIRKQGVAKPLEKGHPLRGIYVMQFPPSDQRRWPARLNQALPQENWNLNKSYTERRNLNAAGETIPDWATFQAVPDASSGISRSESDFSRSGMSAAELQTLDEVMRDLFEPSGPGVNSLYIHRVGSIV